MQTSSPAAGTISVADQTGSKLLHAIASFMIRRRILISAVLFAVIIAQDVAYGPKPHDVANLRDPVSVAGLLLVVTGLGLRSWSAGILRKNAELTMTGPYGLIRNPLYLGSFLMMFGFCALFSNPLNFLVILGPVLVIYVVKVRQEERLLAERFPDQWKVYSKSTPRFFPGLRAASLSAPWSLSQWIRHREYQAVLTSIVALVAIKYWHSMQLWQSARGHFGSMRLLTRYVLREIAQIFLVTLFALTTFMLLVGAVQVALQQGLGAKQIALALPFLLPQALMFAIPGTILFAVSMVFGRMSASNELVALKSLGVSPMVVVWPALALAALLSFCTVWLNDLAMSWGFHGVQQVVVDSAEEIAYSVLRTQKTFKSDAFEVTVRDIVGRDLIEPRFRMPAGDDGETFDIAAQSAQIRSVPGTGSLTLILYDTVIDGPGVHVEYPNEVIEREVVIKANHGKDPSPSHLALSEIPESVAHQRELIEQLGERMVARAGVQILAGDFDQISTVAWKDEAKNLQFQRFQLYRMLTEPPRRWANGFSCLCFALVGTAMAIRMRNADVLTSFALCFFPILLVYYPLLAFGLDRAKAGEIHPYSVWLANCILVFWGIYLLRRVIRY